MFNYLINKKMKKVVLFFAVVAAFAFASCNDSANTQNAVQDAAEVVDSAVAVVDSAATAVVDSAAAIVDSAAAVVDSAAATVAAVVE